MTGLEIAIPLLIAAGTAAYNKWETNKRNEEEKKNNEDEYNKTRQASLEDTERTNQYNSPLQQMNRLRQAGLNPNLIYGKGADNTSAMIRSTDIKKSTPEKYQFDSTPALQMAQGYMDMKVKGAQTDNLALQNELMQKDGLLKDATTAKIAQETSTSKFQLSQSQELKDLVIDQAKANLLNTQTTTKATETGTQLTAAKIQETAQNMQLAVNADERSRLQNNANVSSTLQQIAQRNLEMAKNPDEVALLKATLANAQNEGLVKQAQGVLAKEGIQPSDPWYFKQMAIIMMKLRNELKQSNTTPSGISLPPIKTRQY